MSKPTHTYVQSRQDAICDFCSSSRVVWNFPCKRDITRNLGPVETTSHGGWAACAKCAPVVDRKDPGALAAHVIAVSPKHLDEAAAQLQAVARAGCLVVPGLPPLDNAPLAVLRVLAEELLRGQLVDLYTLVLPALEPKTADLPAGPHRTVFVDAEGRFDPEGPGPFDGLDGGEA